MSKVLTKQGKPLTPEQLEERNFLIYQMTKAQIIKSWTEGVEGARRRESEMAYLKQESKAWYKQRGLM